MNQQEKTEVVIDVDRVWQRHRATKDVKLTQAAEHLAVNVLSEDKIANAMPNAVEYTTRSGDFAYAVAEHDKKVAILTTDRHGSDWFKEHGDNDVERNIVLFDSDVKLNSGGFILSPTGGWRLVLLRDVMLRLAKDDDLVGLLNAIRPTLAPGGLVVFNLQKITEGAYNEELDGVLLTEVIRKLRPRVYERTVTVRTDDEGYVNTESLMSWSVSDVHYCAREIKYKPVTDHGLDVTSFCCYTPS